MLSTAEAVVPGGRALDRSHRRVIFASSLGTVFEWYDFYLYGALSLIISRQFFSGVNETTGFIFALLAFAAGFFIRPFGALVFGRLGDLIGRKYTQQELSRKARSSPRKLTLERLVSSPRKLPLVRA